VVLTSGVLPIIYPIIKLESKIRELALLGDPVHVLTGPYYGKEKPSLPGADEAHQIPAGYWKVVVRNQPDFMVTAFIFSQNTMRKADYCHSTYILDVVERKTGLQILPDIKSYKPDDSLCSAHEPSYFECGC
jgi:endonuclease G